VLLTRAPLNRSCIATQTAPCDLHVLNTPPAFVLSQNQTLRKKFGWRLSPRGKSVFQIDLGKPLAELAVSARILPMRAAHNSIFFLFPAVLGLIRAQSKRFRSAWLVPCWATLSKIIFRGD
jgi:hypothetical protein